MTQSTSLQYRDMTKMFISDRSILYKAFCKKTEVVQELERLPDAKKSKKYMPITTSKETILGKNIQAKDNFPSSEDFGKTAGPYCTLEQTMRKFNEL